MGNTLNRGRSRFGRAICFAGVSALALCGSAYAQDDATDEVVDDVEIIEEASEEESLTQDKITITGSRIARNEFTSISPVQILSADVSRAVGLVSAADILQNSTADSGLKIDATFNGFVLDNGPGGNTVSLRGLGAERTLLLLNNRRIAPAGVEGAPSVPDLNLIPSILLDRIEVLLDGSSSIYGADAVAGVANAILRDDIEGFEIAAEFTAPTETGGAGKETILSAAWGQSNDRGYIGFGAEYTSRERVKFSDREFTEECEKDYVINPDNGDIVLGGTDETGCDFLRTNRILDFGNPLSVNPVFGSIYFTEGSTNIGIPNFSESQASLFGVPVPDAGIDTESDFYNILNSDAVDNADLVSEQERWSMVAYGEYDLDWNNSSVFFEALYSKRETDINTGPFLIFPTIPAENAFNPCNEVACYQILDPLLPASLQSAILPVDWYPILSIKGDRETVLADVAQTRFVGGIRGDLTAFQNAGLDNWTYEVSAQYSESSGQSQRQGLNNDRLILSLQTSREVDGEIVCGIDTDGDGLPNNENVGVFNDEDLLTVPCVPVNLFAPSIYQEGGGEFATQAEADYLFTTRNFNTQIDQTVISGIIQGDLFELPWNGSQVPLVLGFEYRDEGINSIPDQVARDGLLFGTISDQGATGRRDLYEGFAETEITPIRGIAGAEELTFNLSTRWTEESNFGALWTYSGKVKYRPVDWLALNFTTGTSYRAPGLREQFLAGTTGFNTVTDPCIVPTDARTPGAMIGDPDTYDPTNDERSPQTLANCVAAGVDPLSLGLAEGLTPTQSTEINSGGTLDLLAEESESFTYGFTLDQPWFDSFDLRLNVTYYDTEITDSVAEPSAAFIVRDCYIDNPNLASGFCSRITRDGGGLLDVIDSSVINIGRETAKGFDINVLFEKEFIFNERPLDFAFDVRANKAEERLLDLSNLLADTASAAEIENSIDDNIGEISFPEWRVNTTLSAAYGDWTGRFFSRYISGGQNDRADTFDPTAPDNPVDFTDDYFVHNASISYNPGTWDLTVGVENVFGEEPPVVDPDGAFSVRNVPIGTGYDVFGRTVFVQIAKQF